MRRTGKIDLRSSSCVDPIKVDTGSVDGIESSFVVSTGGGTQFM